MNHRNQFSKRQGAAVSRSNRDRDAVSVDSSTSNALAAAAMSSARVFAPAVRIGMRELAVETDPAVKYSPNKGCNTVSRWERLQCGWCPNPVAILPRSSWQGSYSAVAKLRVIHQDRGGVVGLIRIKASVIRGLAAPSNRSSDLGLSPSAGS